MNTKIGSFILVALVFFVLVAFSYVVSVNAQSSATTTIPSSIIVDDTTPPLVTINLPVDGALYNFANFPLLFNVTLNENGSVEYSLNSGDHNFTMSSDEGGVFGVEFNATNSSMADGIYTFSVYANDTTGNNNFSERMTFTVQNNPGLFIISPSDGQVLTSTDYTVLFDATLLDRDSCWYSFNGGEFNNSIDCSTASDSVSFSLSSAEGSYSLTVYVNYTTGEEISDGVAFIVDLTGGNGDNGNGGPSGGGGFVDFTITSVEGTDIIEVEVFRGDRVEEDVVIENTGTGHLRLVLNASDSVRRFVSFGEFDSFLSVGEILEIPLIVFASEDEVPGVYTGNVSVKASVLLRSVDLIVQVLQRDALFDLGTELSDVTLTRAQKIDTTIVMTDLSDLGNVNVFLEYFVKDFDDNEIKLGEENLFVDGTIEIRREFDFPDGIRLGNKVFYMKLTYQGNVAIASSPFKVISVFIWLILLIILLALAIAAITWWLVVLYLDKDLQKIKQLIKEGDRALSVGNVKLAVDKYKLIRKIYHRISRPRKAVIQGECLKYYVRVKNRVLEKRDKRVQPKRKVIEHVTYVGVRKEHGGFGDKLPKM